MKYLIAGFILYFDPLKNRPQGQYTIWYFDPGVDFSSLYFEPHHGKFTSVISTKRWEFDIPWVGGSKYHG